jgi:hypothetical protein
VTNKPKPHPQPITDALLETWTSTLAKRGVDAVDAAYQDAYTQVATVASLEIGHRDQLLRHYRAALLECSPNAAARLMQLERECDEPVR